MLMPNGKKFKMLVRKWPKRPKYSIDDLKGKSRKERRYGGSLRDISFLRLATRPMQQIHKIPLGQVE